MAKDVSSSKEADEEKKEAGARREIPGNLPYLSAPGSLKTVLEKIIEAQRPEKFTLDYLQDVLKMNGGSARATIPILKRLGFLSSDGTPTEIYSRFKTDSGRGAATIQALKNGFPEVFKRSEYAHAAEDAKLQDIIVEITGLQAADPVARSIRATFKTVKAFIPANFKASAEVNPSPDEVVQSTKSEPSDDHKSEGSPELRLAYNINIIVPETSDLAVLNAIFRSVKENLLK